MANLLNPDEKDTTTAPGGDTDVSLGGGSGGSTPNLGSQTPTQPTAQTANQPKAGGTQANTSQITNLNQNASFQPVVDYVKGQGDTAKSAIAGEQSGFDTAFGQTPTFGQQQQQTLSDVLGGKQDISVGQNMLNTKYTGPQGVNRQNYDPQVQQYVTSANQTGNQAGISSLLGGLYPALTPGERSFDAIAYGNNPNYQTASKGLIADAAQTQTLADTTAKNSYDAVAQRQKDVQAFNQAAQGYVQQQRDAINNAVTNTMNNVNAKQGQYNDEIAQLKSGAKNFSDYNAADFGFDPSQQGPQNFAADQSKYIVPQGTLPQGAMNLASLMYGAGFPDIPQGLKPTQYAQMAPTAFNQSVDPRQYLQYDSSPMSRMQAMTADQANQYDRAEQLLYENDYVDPSKVGGGGGGGQIGLNTSALQQALAQAQQGMASANSANQDWYNKQMNIQNLPLVGKEFGHWQTPTGGGIPVDSSGKPLTADQIAALQAPQQPQRFASGGMVQPDPGALSFQNGGPVPLDAGPTNIPDTVPARVSPGEFVVNKPSTQAAGPQNVQALNTLSQRTPMQQAMVRSALQDALSRAAVTPPPIDVSGQSVGAVPFRPHSTGTFGQSAAGITDQTTQKQTQALAQQRRKRA